MKKEKRNYLILVAFFLITLSFIQGVYAASIVDDLNSLVNGATSFFKPLTATLLGETASSDVLFAKVLFFIVILSMVWLSLSKISFFNPENNALWVIWTVSIAVSVLAVRYITDSEWIQTILLPYSTLGIVLAAGFPFVIYFMLIEVGLTGNSYKTIRKVAWIFFGIVFLFLYVSRSEVMGSARSIYFYTALLSFFVTVFDGTFQTMLHRAHINRSISQSKDDEAIEVQRKIDKLLVQYRKHGPKGPTGKMNILSEIDTLRKRLITLSK